MRTVLIILSLVLYAAAAIVAAAALMIPAAPLPSAPPAADPLLEESLDRLARERAADRRLVADLKDTITELQGELARDKGNEALEELTREQAADRKLVADLKDTIAELQSELARDEGNEALEELTREQAADRKLVADLRTTIIELQSGLARERRSEALEELTREQAASRELIADLKENIISLQKGESESAADRDRVSAAVNTTAGLSGQKQSTETAARRDVDVPSNAGLSGEFSKGETPGRALSLIGGGLFRSGQVAPNADLNAAVEKIVPVIALYPEHRVSVEGHTDNTPLGSSLTGKYDDNRALSLSRARMIARLLQEQGVSAERMVVIGYGSTRPLASNDTVAGRAENRRVEIRLIPPAGESEE